MSLATEQTLGTSADTTVPMQISSNDPPMRSSDSAISVAKRARIDSTLLSCTTHVQIGPLRLERELFTDIKLGTIGLLQMELDDRICRPFTNEEMKAVCCAQGKANGPKAGYSGLLNSAVRTMFALQKASVNSEIEVVQKLCHTLREYVFKLSRKIQIYHETRVAFANSLQQYLENRACFALLKALIHEPDVAFASRFWEQVAIQAQQEEALGLLNRCTMVLDKQSHELRQQMLLTREDADN